MTEPTVSDAETINWIDALAAEIRRVDGNHSLGAGALAEALLPFIVRSAIPEKAVVRSLERLLLEFDFLVEAGHLPDIRNDMIFDEARRTLALAASPATGEQEP